MTDHTEELLKVPQLGAFIDWAWGLKERIAALEAENERLRATPAQEVRQEAACWVPSACLDKLRSGRNNSPAVLTDCPGEFNDTPLYTTPQPGPDVRALAAFFIEIFDGALDGGSFDGGDIQDAGVRHGLLIVEQREESCGEHCACAEYGFPVDCYRLAPALSAHRQAQRQA